MSNAEAVPAQSSSSRDFFRTSVAEYDRAHYSERSFMTDRLECVLEAYDQLDLPAGAEVFEGGCGPGYLVHALRERGAQVTAIDTSRGMVDLTAHRVGTQAAPCPAHLALGSIDALPIASNRYDVVTSCGVIEYLSDNRPTLAEFHRILKPGGYLVLPTTSAASPMFVFDELVEAFKRNDLLRDAFNAVWTRLGRTPIRAREFTTRRHDPRTLRREVTETGFELVDESWYHLLPWPHPLDVLLPGPTRMLRRLLERGLDRPLRRLSDGYLVVARKRPASDDRA